MTAADGSENVDGGELAVAAVLPEDGTAEQRREVTEVNQIIQQSITVVEEATTVETTSTVIQTSSTVMATSSRVEATSSKVEATSSRVEETSSKMVMASSRVQGTSSKVETSSRVKETSSKVEETSTIVEEGSSAAQITGSTTAVSGLVGGGLPAEAPLTLELARAGSQPAPQGDYDPETFKPELAPNMYPIESMRLANITSMDSTKRNNIFLMENNILLTSAGNNVVFLNLETGGQTYLTGLDGGGIGAVRPHPSRSFFAVAEKNLAAPPNIYIYEYPSMKLRKVLRNGTECAFTALAFNNAGNMLGSVGSYPDYMLTLWRWEEEKVVLRAKAFSQEVFNIAFSPFFDGSLITSGTGHIRFWKMASTFTGLKLQGAIGKFGAVELSDVADYAEFPDGKVLSSTESGDLIIWDGGLIKSLIQMPGGKPCHTGPVEVVELNVEENYVRTAGADGYVRFWDFEVLNEAEPEEDSHTVYLEPTRTVRVGDGIHIKSIVNDDHNGRWIILDEKGAISTVEVDDSQATVKRLMEFHSGSIVGLATCPSAHFAVTAGADGSVRLYDYRANRMVYKRHFSSAATTMLMLPPHIDPSQRVVLVGFEDGVVRALARTASEWRLVAALKPHKKAASAIAVSHDGKMLATASRDGSVFFFGISSPVEYEPIAFTVMQAAINTISFSEDSARLLMGCESGEVMEVTLPNPQELDTSRTFEVTLPVAYYDFVLPKPPKEKKKKTKKPKTEENGEDGGKGGSSDETAPKDPPVHEEEAAEETKEGGEGDKEGEDAEKVGEEEEAEEADANDDMFPVRHVQYVPGTESSFFLSLGGKAAGKLYECSMEDPGSIVQHPSTAAAVSSLVFSHSKRFLLYGSTAGRVRVTPLDKEQGRPLYEHWEATLHDSQRGAVRGAVMSFDDNYLLTVSEDGSFYVNQVQSSQLRGEPLDGDEWELSQDERGRVTEAEDITDGAIYSIEEAKQKTEEDNLAAAADAKKLSVREYLNRIRKEFDNLLRQNESKPEAQQLPREEFEIDPGLRAMIAEEMAQKEEAARKELAWENEKARLMLAKARKWFLDDVEVERIVLYGFLNRKSVTSFRTRKLSEELQLEIARVHNILAEEKENGANRGLMQDDGDEDRGGRRVREAGIGPAAGKSSTSLALEEELEGKKLTKADLRRIARRKREAEWEAFNATKPDKDKENPDDVDAIREAEANMGDFKLKSDPNYVVPEGERMNKEKKRRQMILLEEGMYNIRMEFNRRFLALRDVKKKVCMEIKEKNKRLQELQATLSVSASLFEPSMKPEETPEARDEVSQGDLEAFAAGMAAKDLAGSGGGTGFGAFGGSGGAPKDKAAGDPKFNSTASSATGRGAAQAEADDPRAKAASQVPLSDLERMEQEIRRRREQCEMEKLTREVADMVHTFDEALSKLRREKFKLEADLKQAEIKKLVMYQELQLLKDFEKREDTLTEKLQAKLSEKREVVDKIKDCQEKLEVKKAEVDNLVEHKKAVASEFDELVEDGHTFREPLLKIFMRKIKRSKNKGQGESDDEDYDSDAEDEDENDEDEDFDDEDEDEEICPPGCDQVLYEKVCDLREKRLDQEDVIAEFQKGIDGLKKEKEQYSKKQKLVEIALAKINQDIIEFQKEKQGKLNEIDVVVTLAMHQMEYLVEQKLPYDLSQALVFSNTELEKLKSRIRELDQEKVALRRQQQELRKEHQQLLRDKKAKEGRISELDKRAYNVQMLKFGQEIDLELLDRIGTTRGAEELREQLKAQESKHAAELNAWDGRLTQMQDQMMALTVENTECLQTVATLSKQQKDLETKLGKTQRSLFSDPITQRRKEIAERDSLVQEINLQAKEINSLKAQIAVLRRKDTSMYE